MKNLIIVAIITLAGFGFKLNRILSDQELKIKEIETTTSVDNEWSEACNAYSLYRGSGCRIRIGDRHSAGDIHLQVRYRNDYHNVGWKNYTPGTWIRGHSVDVRVRAAGSLSRVKLIVESEV